MRVHSGREGLHSRLWNLTFSCESRHTTNTSTKQSPLRTELAAMREDTQFFQRYCLTLVALEAGAAAARAASSKMKAPAFSVAASSMAHVFDEEGSSDTKPKNTRAKKAARRARAKAKAAAAKAAGKADGKGGPSQRELQNDMLDRGSCFKWEKGARKNKDLQIGPQVRPLWEGQLCGL